MKLLKYKHHARAVQAFVLLLTAITLLSACKNNLDYDYDYRPDTKAGEASSIRLINMSINAQLLANGDSITNFFLPPNRSGYIPPEETTPPGTKYFPKNGRLGLTWDVPQELLLEDGTVKFKSTSHSYLPVLTSDVEFTAKEDNTPKDYYLLLSDQIVEWNRPVVEVPRSIDAPSRPDYFKIRIVNFAAADKNTSSPMENLVSAMSLTYADGTPLSDATSNIQPGAWSEYVEIPYGTYQLKVLTTNGRQVPAAATGMQYIFPATSTMAFPNNGIMANSNITFATAHTFQPGGVYTLVVHPKEVTWNNGVDDFNNLQNSFRIIEDIDAPQNRTYARVQLANALPGSKLTLKVSSSNATAATTTGNASAYVTQIAGNREFAVQDASGQTIVTQTEQLQAGGNYTLWVYTDKNNKAQAVLVVNNLGGSYYVGSDSEGGNASTDIRTTAFPFHFRFLNLSPDVPYLTFTDGSGLPFNTSTGNAGTNLQPGIPKMDDPYTRIGFYQMPTLITNDVRNISAPYHFLSYASAPGKVPGDRIKEIPMVNSQALIARRDLYTQAGRALPYHEPGVYTIALIGRNGQPSGDNAQIMIVKHLK